MSKVDGSTSAAKKRRLAKLEGSNPKTSTNTIEVKSIASPSLVSAAAVAPPHPVYDALPRGLLAAEVLKVPPPARDPQAAVEALVGGLVSGNGARSSAPYSLRMQDKSILLENPVKAKSKGGGARQTAKRARRQGGTLSAAALATVTYLGLLPVHALWRAYAERLAARDPGVTLEAYRDRLLGAELHGALVRVKACAARPDAAGLTGIVALSRPHSLVLVTPGDRRIRIPRQNSTLELLMGTRLVALEYGEDVGQG
uniref:Uncharacterized protein n=2 Tax=Auxenochlorella protothecoides TaxID=3075 RepID=A0A1D2A681_AUXPR